MSSVVIFRARQVMIAICLLAAFFSNASASPKTITVQGQTGRPVAEAILELERRYGWQITYEDPRYVHYSDIVDVTDIDRPEVPVQSQSQLELLRGAHRTLGPKTVSLTFTLPSADPDEMAAVEALLKSYNEGHRGFEFAVVQGKGLLHVVPRQARGLSGNLEPVKPVLDTLITIEPKERTFGALVKEVFKKGFRCYEHPYNDWHCLSKYVNPLEACHRRIGEDGAVYFRAMDSGGRRRVVMAAIECSRYQ